MHPHLSVDAYVSKECLIVWGYQHGHEFISLGFKTLPELSSQARESSAGNALMGLVREGKLTFMKLAMQM